MPVFFFLCKIKENQSTSSRSKWLHCYWLSCLEDFKYQQQWEWMSTDFESFSLPGGMHGIDSASIMSPMCWVHLWLPASMCLAEKWEVAWLCPWEPLGAPWCFCCLKMNLEERLERGALRQVGKKKLHRDNDLRRWQCLLPPRCFGWCSLGVEDSRCQSQSWSGQGVPWEEGGKVRRCSAGLFMWFLVCVTELEAMSGSNPFSPFPNFKGYCYSWGILSLCPD